MDFLAACSLLSTAHFANAQPWEPGQPVEVVVPAGTGDAADKMARMIQAVVYKHRLMSQPLTVANRYGGSGAEAYMEMERAKGNPHKIAISLTSLVPQDPPMRWRKMTPVATLVQDRFVLWVNASAPYTTVTAYLKEAASKSDGMSQPKLGGTGNRHEDQWLARAIEKHSGAKQMFIPFKGAGDVVEQLAGGFIDASVSNPIEAVDQWRTGKLRPLCVFDDAKMPNKTRITAKQAWSSIPTCKAQGLPLGFRMLRGVFLPPGVTAEQRAYYIELLRKVRQTPEWKSFVEEGAFDQNFMTGDDFSAWLEVEDRRNDDRIRDAGI